MLILGSGGSSLALTLYLHDKAKAGGDVPAHITVTAVNSRSLDEMRHIHQAIGFAIPVSTAKAVLDQIISHGMVIRGWFGVEYADVSALSAGTPETTPLQRGVVVVEVLPGGPADNAGLRRGDLLLKLDAEEIIDQADLRSHEAALAPGTTAHLSGLRGGTPFSVEITLMQRPQITASGT